MTESVAALSEERIGYLEGLVRQGRTAAAVFTQFSPGDVDSIVKAMVLAGLDRAQYLTRLAIEETLPQQNLWGDSGSGSRPKL